MEAEAIVVQYPVMTEARPDGVEQRASEDVPHDEPGAELVRCHVSGDAAAFGALIAFYQAPVYGFFLRSGVPRDVADDLFQETFLRVHQYAHAYAPERSFRVWLFTIAHNLLRSHHRKRWVRRVLVDWWAGPPGEERAFDPPTHEPSPADEIESREGLRWVEGALGRLSDGPRRAIVLTQIEGLKLSEAAEVLGVPVATLKTWVHRGRKELAVARREYAGGVL